MATDYTNRFGRRQSRGLRPWLLLPKVVAVAVYVGSLASALVLWLASGFPNLDIGDPRRLWVLDQVGALIEYLAVPALSLALLLGMALLLQHPRQFLRMRWLIVKLVSLGLLIPTAHLYCSSRLALLREGFAQRTASYDAAADQFAWGLALTLVASIGIVILGRLKPRLGQNWARSYAAALKAGSDTGGEAHPAD